MNLGVGGRTELEGQLNLGVLAVQVVLRDHAIIPLEPAARDGALQECTGDGKKSTHRGEQAPGEVGSSRFNHRRRPRVPK